jgi:hypothetical protein
MTIHIKGGNNMPETISPVVIEYILYGVIVVALVFIFSKVYSKALEKEKEKRHRLGR